ncbi:MAG: hypothetical protein AAGF97_02820 [Planctomycetota bacterium]
MEELRSQVAKVRRRLFIDSTLRVIAWTLFVTLCVSVIGLAIPKIWPMAVDSTVWVRSWLVGGLIGGLLVGLLLAWRRAATSLDAAIEIDRRFGLKERVSSTLALGSEEAETEAGRALVEDASRRLNRIDVREQFSVRASAWNLLPLIPAVLAFLLIALIPDARQEADANTSSVEVKKQIERSTEELKKRMASRRKQAEAQGLEEAKEIFEQLEKQANKLNQSDASTRKKALAKLNDMAETVKQRRAEMGNREDLKKQLSQLRNLKPGPASKLTKAIKKGDFGKAVAEIKKLQAQIKSGELDEKQIEQMANQLKQMSDKLQQMAQAQQQMKSELQKQLEQAKKAGDLAKASQLQNQLNQMQAQSQQMQQMQKLAQQMAQAAKAAQQGQSAEASAQMESIAQSLQQMQSEADQLEMLEDALDQLASAKSSLKCQNCGGTGCTMCQGGMGGMQNSGMPRMGMGRGQGEGDRPEAETGSQFYDSRVQGEVRRGKAVITGFAGGPNRTSDSVEEVKQVVAEGVGEDDDPLTGARLPRDHRKHAQQYFDSLRDGDGS